MKLCEGPIPALSFPIRIVHLITELNVGGAEQMLYKLSTRMDPDRFRSVVVAMTDFGPVGKRVAGGGIPVFTLGMSPGKPSIGGAWKLHRLIRRERPHILQTWLYHADLLGLLVGRLSPVKRIVLGVRCSAMDMKNYRFMTTVTLRSCSFLSSWADAIVVNSEEGKKAHSKLGYPHGKMVTIPNGFDTELFRPDPESRDWLRAELGLSRDAILVGLVARVDPMKDHATFLKAATLLSRKEDVHFLLVGKGAEAGNSELLALLDSGMKDRVHLLGPREDVHRINAGLDIATSSSSYGEGFSNTIGEAMACGVPCVVTDVGDSATIVGDSGLVVNPKDPRALANGWGRLLEMGRGERLKLGEKARARILEKFSMEQVATRFERFYEDLLAGSGMQNRFPPTP